MFNAEVIVLWRERIFCSFAECAVYQKVTAILTRFQERERLYEINGNFYCKINKQVKDKFKS